MVCSIGLAHLIIPHKTHRELVSTSKRHAIFVHLSNDSLVFQSFSAVHCRSALGFSWIFLFCFQRFSWQLLRNWSRPSCFEKHIYCRAGVIIHLTDGVICNHDRSTYPQNVSPEHCHMLTLHCPHCSFLYCIFAEKKSIKF